MFVTVPFQSSFDRTQFDCGIPSLNHYLKEQASQDIKKRLTVIFVVLNDSNQIIAYYTLSNDSIKRSDLEESVQSKIPKSYETVPTMLIGRLAATISVQGQNIGKLLLMDAIKKAYDTSQSLVGSMAIVVHPINESAVKFYSKYGFVALHDGSKMFLPMKTVKELFYF